MTLAATIRLGPNLVFAELVACFGLVIVILGGLRHGTLAVAGMVGLYITAGYWFTASTSFANPAVTIARALTDTFSGIRPADVPWFIAAQLCGAVLALVLGRWLFVAPAPTATSDAAAPVQLTDEGARDQRAA